MKPCCQALATQTLHRQTLMCVSAVEQSYHMLKDPLDARPYSHSMREQLKQEQRARSYRIREGGTVTHMQITKATGAD